jgi:hypothetical protein
MPAANRPDDLIAALTDAPQVADALNDAMLRHFEEINRAEGTALDSEQKRLEAKYGVDSAQARAAAARHALLELERSTIRAELERRSIPTPTADPEHFVVFGRVLGASGEPLRSATVTAVDQAKETHLARAHASDRGVFELRVPIRDKARQADADERDQSRPEGSLLRFRLHVSTRESGSSFQGDEVFEAVSDRIAYREVLAPDETTEGRAEEDNGPQAGKKR